MRCNCQHLLLVLLAAACCAPWGTAQPLEVVKLTDKTFEHQTQASTGQTTGHWCVLFTDSSADSEAQIAAEEAWEELAADEDKAVIYAAMDVAGSPQLGTRFFGSQQQHLPAVRLFRDRQMYAFPGRLQPDPDSIRQALLEFVAGGYQEVEGAAVPGKPSALSGVAQTLQQLRGQAEQWGGALAVAAGVVLFLGAALAGMVLKRQAPSSSASPATPYSSRPGSRRTSSPGSGGTKPAAAGPGKSGLAHVKSALAAEYNEALTEGDDDAADIVGGAKADSKTATQKTNGAPASDKKAD